MKMHLFKTAAVAAAAVAAFTFASAVHAAEISDTTQLYYNRLKTLGIVSETGDFDKTLTRGEMARIVCEVGRYNTVNSGGKIFSDVPEDHQYANYINAAYEHGIISGYPAGSFGPEDEVTREQMYKMLLSVAGYSVFAEQNGGYPSGYMSIASSNSLILKRSGSVTIEEAIYSTFKTIEMPVVKMTYAPNLKYEKDPEHTLLSVILDEEDMEIWDGVMSFDGITSINSDELPNENYMEIGGNRVANGGADAAGLLGKHVEYFVDDGGVCAVYEYPGKNREVTFSAEDINYASKQSYSVYLDGSSSRRTSLRLSGGLNVVYNRQGLEGWSEDDLIPSNGSVTLIDNNDDGDYDVAIVSDRRYYVVDSASSEGLSVRFKLYENQSESGYNINESDLGSSIYYYVTDSEGVRRDPSAVSKNSVIGVAKSRDGKIMDVVVTKKAVDGTLDALSDKSLTVNGISYDTIRIGAGEYPVFDVKPGDTVTIYINENISLRLYYFGS